MTNYPLTVFSTVNGTAQAMDLGSWRLRQRTIDLWGPITAESAHQVVSQLEYLEKSGSRPITLSLNSSGGDLHAALAIYDAIQSCCCDVRTVCYGMAASAAALLLAAGTPGNRFALPCAQIMVHQPRGGIQGEVTDIALAAEHLCKQKTQLVSLLAKHCRKTESEIVTTIERDTWMSAQEACTYGLVDHIGKPD